MSVCVHFFPINLVCNCSSSRIHFLFCLNIPLIFGLALVSHCVLVSSIMWTIAVSNGQSKAPRQNVRGVYSPTDFLVWTSPRLNWKLPRFTARMMYHMQTAQQCVAEEEQVEISEEMNICLHRQCHWQMFLLGWCSLVVTTCFDLFSSFILTYFFYFLPPKKSQILFPQSPPLCSLCLHPLLFKVWLPYNHWRR